MATMRNGLETWLKFECATKGEKLIGYLDVIEPIYDLSKELGKPDESIKFGTTGAKGYMQYILSNSGIVTACKELMDKDDANKLDIMVNSIGKFAENNETYQISRTLDDIRHILTKSALEQVVECQCGKHITGPYYVQYDEYAKNYKVWIDRPDLSVGAKVQGVYQTESDAQSEADRENRELGNSTLGGRVTNPDASNTGSCTCTAGKEMCWKHGVQGTLTKDQKEDMCTIWNPIKQEGK